MRSEPDPAGSRWIPPTRLRVEVGGDDRGPEHGVMLVLSRLDELEAFRRAFEKLGWGVGVISSFESAVERRFDEIDILMTDHLELLTITKSGGLGADVVFVTDDDPAKIAAAEEKGAAHVLVRPINLSDPLGFATP